MKNLSFVLFVVLLSVTGLFAKDKPQKEPPKIEVGIFVQTIRVNLGVKTYQVREGQSVTTGLSHLVDIVDAPEGRYTFEEPIDKMLAYSGAAVDTHRPWFVDNLHPGDKVLFVPDCRKSNDYCYIAVPDPDNPEKYIGTAGSFVPAGSQPKSNTKVLCGTGKLSAEVEAQVCK